MTDNHNSKASDNKIFTKHFCDVKQEEADRIGLSDPNDDAKGLAFSGGGIRSASFGMGLMQSFVAQDKLQEIDYLSSVSGGGYLSSSLTWFLSQRKPDGSAKFGTRPDNFPFGRKNIGAKCPGEKNHNQILDYIRQHGNYLIPGKGLTTLSLIATVLRVIVGSFLVYFSLLIAAIFLLVAGLANIVGELPELSTLASVNWPQEFGFLFSRIFFIGAVLVSILFVFTSFAYSFATHSGVAKYDTDVYIQRQIGFYLKAIGILLVFAALPVLQTNLDLLFPFITGDEVETDFLIASGVSVSASFLGSIFAFLLHRKQVSSEAGISPTQVIITSILVLFGLLLGAYIVAIHLFYIAWANFGLWTWLGYFGFLVFILYVGTRCNVNIFGLNRMYRDRLMETFMPDNVSVHTGEWHKADDANGSYVADMCTTPNQKPYHLINCNVVLVDSDNAKYRGRKGDSFTVSPLYCGSDATGWRKTNQYLKGAGRSGITLPTAMAISGAAANPNSGVAGKGPTTNKFLSLLMSMLNLRLGFWADNPKEDRPQPPPNYINPGIKGSTIFGKGLSETEKVLELSDGGHFENLALYELFRRRIKLIFVSDGGQDQNYEFADLGNAVEKARVDFGIKIVFDEKHPLEDVMPGSEENQDEATKRDYLLSKRGFAIAKIYYPKTDDEEQEEGILVYFKPALIDGIGADIIAYKRANDSYPNQSTIDQFFNEVQFEAYRELGFVIGTEFFNNLGNSGSIDSGLLNQIRSQL